MVTYREVIDPKGVSGTSVTHISADGTTVAGTYTDASGVDDSFVESLAHSLYADVSDPNGHKGSTVYGITGVNAISADGAILAGYYTNKSNLNVGFVENVSTGVYTDVNDPNATDGTSVFSISADGSIVAGMYTGGLGDASYVENLGTHVFTDISDSDATFGTSVSVISADGTTVAGYYGNSSGTFGFVENLASGVFTKIADPKATGITAVSGISSDGSIVSGYYSSGSSYVGFVENVATHVYKDVVDPKGANIPIGNVLSANGEFVAGSYDDAVTGLGVGFVENLATGVFTDISPPAAAQGTQVFAISADGETVAGSYFDSNNNEVGFVANIACYGRGTSILTPTGEVAIETLAVGDLVVVASGQARPIKWIGHRDLDCARHPAPGEVQPIRINAGAFGDNLPRRDLWLSPGHNIAFEGALIEARRLVNGRSVAQVERERFEYWHLELDTHDVIFAEGMPAESYLDTGNRTAFVNGGAFIHAHPDFRPKHWAQTCLPLEYEGPRVVCARRRLLHRLGAQGLMTREADLHIVADGERVEPMKLEGRRVAFQLPEGREHIRLTSRTFIPEHSLADSADPRSLGVCVGAMQIDGEAIALSRAAIYGTGWHELEPGQRWTNGEARLPPNSRLVVIDLAGEGHYWQGDPATGSVMASV